MDQERSSEFEGDRRVFDALVDYTRDLVGSLGAFDLGYGEDDMARAQNIIASTVTGRVRERSAFGRSVVTVEFQNGDTIRETGYSGCASLFVPQPGWARWGSVTEYEPY